MTSTDKICMVDGLGMNDDAPLERFDLRSDRVRTSDMISLILQNNNMSVLIDIYVLHA